jgi:hypothetical protein
MLHQLIHYGFHELSHRNPLAAVGLVAGTAVAGVLGSALLPALAIIGSAAAVGAGINALVSSDKHSRGSEGGNPSSSSVGGSK